MSKVNSQDNNPYDHKALLEQFKQHIHRTQNRNEPIKINYEYKKIFSELVLSNKQKKSRLILKKNKPQVISAEISPKQNIEIKSPILFKKLQMEESSASLSKLNSMIVTQKTIGQQLFNPYHKVDCNNLESLEENIIMQNMYYEKLSKQISDLKQSHLQLKKQLENARIIYSMQIKKQKKYKQISYLSQSVQQQTQHVRINNLKDYRQMIKKQSEIINNLKKYKIRLRRQAEDLQSKYLNVQPIKNIKRPQTHKVYKSQQKFINRYNNNISNIINKNNLKFIENIEKLLQLFSQKQENFDNIKNSQCTKIRLNKINTQNFDEETLKKLNIFYKFQQKYEIKLQSASQLIIKIYNNLIENHLKQQKLILQLNYLKQQYQQQQKLITNRNENPIYDEIQSYPQQSIKQYQEKLKKCNKNSNFFLQIFNMFYSLLMKYKHMYKISLTLNHDKKNFSECMIDIDKIFAQGIYFKSIWIKNKNNTQSNSSYWQEFDIVNYEEFLQIISKYYTNVESYVIKQLSFLIFNDLRNVIILRKFWIVEYLKQHFIDSQDNFYQFIEHVCQECQQVYDSKLKKLMNLVIRCIKSIALNKYQQKMAKNSDYEHQIFYKKSNQQKQDKSDVSESDNIPKSILEAGSTQNNTEWILNSLSDDPRLIIRKLRAIRNTQHQNYKILDFQVEENKYSRKYKLRKSRRISKNILKEIPHLQNN